METYQTLLDSAKSETGLQDFGPDSFREGLEILVNALRKEAKLNPVGEKVVRERILGHLKQRLQVEHWYKAHPEIADESIIQPLIGISLPRTGSTALSFLLAEDPNARSLRQQQATAPCPPPCTLGDGLANDVQEAATTNKYGLKSHVPSATNGPAECQDLMALDFKSHIFQAFAQVPSYSRWLLDADLTSTYLYELRTLKLLQWNLPNQPWRLKCPTHLLFLQQLDTAFPDARFVMTHRDPTDVMRSVIDVYVDIVGRFTDHLDIPYLVQLNIEHWSVGMQRALAFRNGGQSQRFYDIHFSAMHSDPVKEVKNLYQWLGEPVSAEFTNGMKRWWAHNDQQRQQSPKSATPDYTLDQGHIRSLFADYNNQVATWTRQSAPAGSTP